MDKFDELNIALKVIKQHRQEHKIKLDKDMDDNNVPWDQPLDHNLIVESIKGCSILIAFDDVIKDKIT